MTPSTDELSRVLRESAADLVERANRPGPDTAALWGRGRRATLLARAAGAGLAGVALVLIAALALVMRPVSPTEPADGVTSTYPGFVSDLFPGGFEPGPSPVFGFVAALGDGPTMTFAVDRRGLLAAVPGVSPAWEGGVPAPDGHHLLTQEGIADLRDGSVVQPMRGEPNPGGLVWSDGRWSPDSQYVLLDTADGPTVLDAFANPVWVPGDDDSEVRPAGWVDASTAMGVRARALDGIRTLEVVTRGLDDPAWATMGPIEVGAVGGQVSPSAVHASPDGSRLLLLYPVSSGSDAGSGVLVDAATGQRVAFAGGDASTAVGWDACTPVWQRNEPLTASGGLNRPTDGATVVEFSGRLDLGCLSLAGNELTGAADPRSAGLLREEVWRVALPLGGALAVIALVWSAIALRRSHRRGERFLPWILTYPF
jgi:hypothetical protein